MSTSLHHVTVSPSWWNSVVFAGPSPSYIPLKAPGIFSPPELQCSGPLCASQLRTAHTSLSHSHVTDRWLGCWRGHCTRQAFLEGSMVWAGAGLSGDCPPLVTESPQGPGKVFLAGLVKTEQAPPARRKTQAQL